MVQLNCQDCVINRELLNLGVIIRNCFHLPVLESNE